MDGCLHLDLLSAGSRYPEWFPRGPTQASLNGWEGRDGFTPSSVGLNAKVKGPVPEPVSVTYSITAQGAIWMAKVALTGAVALGL